MDTNAKTTFIQSINNSPPTIDEIIKMLSWRNSSDTISAGLLWAKDIKCLKAFFQPWSVEYGKDVWENCALVISERTDSELEFYIEDMIRWLQDINWPGAQEILRRLLKMEKTTLIGAIIDSLVPILLFIDDEQWLANLARLLDSQMICNQLRSDTAAILNKYYTDRKG